MNFNNYLIESTILYESIAWYNTILEAVAEIAEIPPSWVVEFTKFENGKSDGRTYRYLCNGAIANQ